jgi:bifunctional non-homologous end joining protein LigD
MPKLAEYNRMRSFNKTTEPKGVEKPSKGELIFVIQKHDASHLHYDFRLEWEGVLKSWSVPKGPSLDPSVKRLAIETEDHPIPYATFEGVIPEGQYGGGDVIVWDRGIYRAADTATLKESTEELKKQYTKGHLSIELFGEKLRGAWALVRTSRPARKPQWLLMKRTDDHASKKDITEEVRSVLSDRILPRDNDGEWGTANKKRSAPKTRK